MHYKSLAALLNRQLLALNHVREAGLHACHVDKFLNMLKRGKIRL